MKSKFFNRFIKFVTLSFFSVLSLATYSNQPIWLVNTAQQAYALAEKAKNKNSSHHTVLIWKVGDGGGPAGLPAAKGTYFDVQIDWSYNGAAFEWERNVSFSAPSGAYQRAIPFRDYISNKGYRVMVIKGRIDHFSLKDYVGDTYDPVRDNLHMVYHLADNQTKSYAQAFDGCSNLQQVSFSYASQALENLWSARVTDASRMFANTPALRSITNTLSLPNATDVSGMFQNAGSNQLSLSLWKLFPKGSKVTKASNIFNGVSSSDIYGMGDWDFSSITDASYIFQGLEDLSIIPQGLKLPNATTAQGMFQGAGAPGQILRVHNLFPKNGNKLRNTSYMFADMQTGDVRGLETLNQSFSAVTDASFMFRAFPNVGKIPQNLNFHKVSNASGMFQNAGRAGQVLDVPNLFIGDTASNLSYLFDSINASVKTMGQWAKRISRSATDISFMFRNVADLNFLSNSDRLYFDKVVNAKGLFQGAGKKGYVLNVYKLFRTGSVKDLTSLFLGSKISRIMHLDTWDTSNVTSITYLFRSAHNLQSYAGIGKWNTSRLIQMVSPFSNATRINPLDEIHGKWDTRNVQNMEEAFMGVKFPIDGHATLGLNTNSVRNMKYMFKRAKFPPMDGINFASVRDADRMYTEATLRRDLIKNVETWNFSRNLSRAREVFTLVGFDGVYDYLGTWKLYSVLAGYFYWAFQNFPKWHKEDVARTGNANFKYDIDLSGNGGCGRIYYPGDGGVNLSESEYNNLVSACEGKRPAGLHQTGVKYDPLHARFVKMPRHITAASRDACSDIDEFKNDPYCAEFKFMCAVPSWADKFAVELPKDGGPYKCSEWTAYQLQCIDMSDARFTTQICEDMRVLFRRLCNVTKPVLAEFFSSPLCTEWRQYYVNRYANP